MSVETLTPTVNTKYRIDVDLADSDSAPEWTQVLSVNSFAPAIANTVQDATDYDSEGWGADAVTLRKWSLPLVLMRKKSPTTSEYSAGQEKLREAADSLALLHVRWYDRTGGPDAYEGWALVQWEPQGGTAEGLSTVNATLLGQGPRTPISNPVDVPAVAVISTVTPASGTAAGGTLATIRGTGFTGTVATTGVKFGGTNATSFLVVDDNTISAVTPAHAAGLVAVLVTNATGASTTGTDKYTYV